MARRSGRKTDYEWSAVCGKLNALDLAINTVGLGTQGFVGNVPLTLMRVHGLVCANLDAGAVDERAMISFGIIKVSDDALAVGITAVPTPTADADAPWIVHGHLWVTTLSEAAIAPDGMFHRVVIDSKAMRKMKPNESLAVVFEVCDTTDQGGTVDLSYGLRVLVGT